MKVVGIADMKISAQAEDTLITYALGSCLGITIYDPVAKVGGLLHIMLPDSSINREKAAGNPYMFVDTGVPQLFKACYRAGAQKERLVLKVAGGAALSKRSGEDDQFNIGKRNFLMLRKLLWKNNVLIKSQDVGADYSRTMSLEIASGDVLIKTNGQEIRL